MIGAAALAAGIPQAAPQGDLTLPAARYCGTLDLKLSAVTQHVRGKVLSRWGNGAAKDTFYNGPLTTRAENVTTGKAKNYDLGGDALESDYPSGHIETYRTYGPVGVGYAAGCLGRTSRRLLRAGRLSRGAVQRRRQPADPHRVARHGDRHLHRIAMSRGASPAAPPATSPRLRGCAT